MRLRITHDTRYTYRPPVETALHLIHMQPPDTALQRTLEHQLRVTPEPQTRAQGLDVYGNQRVFIELDAAHTSLAVRATSLIDTFAAAPVTSQLSWEQVRGGFVYHARAAYQPATEFVFPSVYVHPGEVFADYARASFAPGRPLLEAARELMSRVHHEFSYCADATEINTPAVVALQQRRGVCQDFAHVMLACLRSMGVAARYVSGYLLTQPPPGQPRLIGSDASHAWVSVYLPDAPGADRDAEAGWYDLDPTNHRDGWGTPGEDYVRLAIGRDFADISPMRGVIHGGADHHLDVGVTVEPCDVASLAEAPPI